MQHPSNSSIAPLLLGAVASLLLGGCANDLAPVRTFAEQTHKMSTHFEPMLAGGVHSCMDKAMRQRLILAERFDAQASEQAARADCAAIAQANERLGTTTAIITHNAAIAGMADRVLRLGGGRLVGEERNARRLSAEEVRW